jgi:hypothetical protein
VHALYTNHDVPQIGLKYTVKLAGIGGNFLMHTGIAGLVEDANVERSGVQIDAAVLWMLIGVEFH